MVEYVFLNSANATKQDLDDFVRVVRAGEAVAEHYVRNGIGRKGVKLVFAKVDDTNIGVAALKVPLKTYREGLESSQKSGHSIPVARYPFELGYVAVNSDHAGKGIGRSLVNSVLTLSSGCGLFATTSNPAMQKSILPNVGFIPVGKSWLNAQNESLRLFLYDGKVEH